MKISQKSNTLQLEVQLTAIGTVTAVVDFVQIGVGMEYLFTARNINGIEAQWVETTLSLLTVEQVIVDKLAELFPAPEEAEEEELVLPEEEENP